MRGTGRMVGVVGGLSMCLVLAVAGSAVGQERGPSPAISEGDPSFRQGAERDRARRERLRGREEREARAQSRTRFRELSRGEALELAQQEFPEIVRDRLPDGRRPAPGLEVVEHFGKGAALVEDDQGARSLLRSSGPLQVRSPGGGFVPLDLSLVPAGGGFAPTASGAPLAIGGRVGDGVDFTEGDFSVTYEGREGAELIESNDRAFAGEVATDTDLIVAPRPQGVEVGWTLRSPSAPESFTLRVDLPEGAVLRRARSKSPIPGDPPEAVEIARGDEVLGYVYPPLAYDADGTEVPSRADIDGDRVIVSVDHRDGDFRFPILADPEVIQHSSFSTGWAGWRFTNMSASPRQGYNFFGAAVNDLAYAPGLYQSMPTNTAFDNGAYAHWLYQAPANTYIYRATLGSVSHNPAVVNGVTLSQFFHGLMNPAYSAWEQPVNYQNQSGGLGPNPFGPATIAAYNVSHDFCFTTRCDRSKGTQQNMALFAIQAVNPYGGGLYTGNSKATVPMGWANIYLGDRNVPTVTQAPSSATQWVDDGGGNHQAQIKASDIGLGVKRYTLTGARDGTITGQNSCTGNVHTSACPTNPPPYTFTYRLDEGVRTMGFYAHDVVDNRSDTRTWTQRIDRSAPQVSVSGSLRDLAGSDIEEGAELTISATDGSASSPSLQRSGVRSLHVYVDGEEQDAPVAQSCTAAGSSCPGTRNYTFVAGDFSPGSRRISVVAEDQVGNRSEPIGWDVTVTPGDPQEKMSYGDDGSAPDSYGAVDDGSTACSIDPEAGAEGQYCNADDASNLMDQAVTQEPPVGQERPLLGDLDLLAARDGSDPPTLRPDGRGWGLSDQNPLTSNNRPGPQRTPSCTCSKTRCSTTPTSAPCVASFPGTSSPEA